MELLLIYLNFLYIKGVSGCKKIEHLCSKQYSEHFRSLACGQFEELIAQVKK